MEAWFSYMLNEWLTSKRG